MSISINLDRVHLAQAHYADGMVRQATLMDDENVPDALKALEVVHNVFELAEPTTVTLYELGVTYRALQARIATYEPTHETVAANVCAIADLLLKSEEVIEARRRRRQWDNIGQLFVVPIEITEISY